MQEFVGSIETDINFCAVLFQQTLDIISLSFVLGGIYQSFMFFGGVNDKKKVTTSVNFSKLLI